MTRDKVERVLQSATVHRSEKGSRINLVWRSAGCGVHGDKCSVMAVVGRSSEGYHAGLFKYEQGQPTRAEYGPALATEAEAKPIAQTAAAEWLQSRPSFIDKDAVLKARGRGPELS